MIASMGQCQNPQGELSVSFKTETMANPDTPASSPAKPKAAPSPADKTKQEQKPKKRRRPPSVGATSRKKKTPTAAAAKKSSTEEPAIRKPLPPAHILIIDNGGDTVKYGWASTTATGDTATGDESNMNEKTTTTSSPFSQQQPHILPNLTARLQHQWTILVGDEIDRVQNPNSLYGITRSTERGIITNLGNQTQVWKRVLDQVGVIVSPTTEAAQALGWGKVTGRSAAAAKKASSSTLTASKPTIPAQTVAVLVLLPPHYPRVLLDQILTVWFEDFGVAHIGFGNSAVCATQGHPTWKTSCVVDVGWSATTIIPTFKKKPITPAKAIRRIPLGGRHMVNMLKYYMSYRQYNLMDQEKILRSVFEELAYLSTEFNKDIAIARQIPSGRRPYDRDYILPDYQTTDQGRVRLPLAMQRQLELEKQQKEGEKGEDQEEESDDEDFKDEDDSESKDDENDDDENDDNDGDGSNNNDDEGSNKGGDDDGDGSDEEEESPEERRERVLKQRDEERRRKQEIEEEEQILRVSVERFTVPEVLFRPLDAGLLPEVMGLSRAIHESIQATPKPYRPALYQHIYITGGVSQLKNFHTRLQDELRTLMPTDYKLEIHMAESPISQAWLGAHEWVRHAPYTDWSISRKEWEAASRRSAYSKLLVSNGGCFV